MKTDPSPIRFALHGGAGDLPPGGDTRKQREALARIAGQAQAALLGGANALEAVALAVALLEDCPLFNAGLGAVLNANGIPECDAAIMDGEDLRCGAVAAVSRIRNPVHLARAVMESSPHVLLCGAGAEAFAVTRGFELIDPQELVLPERLHQLQEARASGSITLDHDHRLQDLPASPDAAFGTVGAVARDHRGHLAAATSTGGLTNKLSGRIGDTPIIGAGTFADDRSVAVSCTGTGEGFIRIGFAHAIHAALIRGESALLDACRTGLEDLSRLRGRGGCIAIDRFGTLALPFTSSAMFRAWASGDGEVRSACAND